MNLNPALALPEGSQVYLTPSTILDEQTARNRANHWLRRDIPEQVGIVRTVGHLFQLDQWVVWRFEVTRSRIEAPDERVGEVDIEARTGQILNSQQTFEQLRRRQPDPTAGSETPFIGLVQAEVIAFDPVLALPPGSQVELVPTTVVDEWTARRKANGWLVSYVGNLVSTGQDRQLLRMDDKAVWRFEGFASRRGAEPVGPLGQVYIEASSGKILNTLEDAEAMMERGNQLFREISNEPE